MVTSAPLPPEQPQAGAEGGGGETADDADIAAAQAALGGQQPPADPMAGAMPTAAPAAPQPLIPNQPAPQFRNPAIQQALAQAESLLI